LSFSENEGIHALDTLILLYRGEMKF
jgi:hypothetical protein